MCAVSDIGVFLSARVFTKTCVEQVSGIRRTPNPIEFRTVFGAVFTSFRLKKCIFLPPAGTEMILRKSTDTIPPYRFRDADKLNAFPRFVCEKTDSSGPDVSTSSLPRRFDAVNFISMPHGSFRVTATSSAFRDSS